jgi:8-oxo-dGTP pyrophosphatase MutT (NUDIX family)
MSEAYAVLLVFASPVLDRFLLARHHRRGWELPGGRIEPGEDPMTAARREWDEETHLPLAALEPLALHARADGRSGHLFLGACHAAPAAALPRPPPGAVDPQGGVVETAWFARLADAAPLAFPDDPYRALAGLVLERTGSTRAWRLPAGETPAAFTARLSAHPDARPTGVLARPPGQ